MKRMNPIEMLPTLVTLGNLFSGFLAIAYLTDSLHTDPGWSIDQANAARIHLYSNALWCIFFAMIFDAVDGKIARMTGMASDFGSQIDSLSDVVSFGAAPALLFKVMVEAKPGVVSPKLAVLLAVLYLACAALRLARFNVETTPDEESHLRFKGLPSPAAAGTVCSLAFLNMHLDPGTAHSWVLYTMPVLVPLIGFLMVSRMPYVHLTNALFRERKPFRFLVALIFGGAFIMWNPEIVIPVAVTGYVLTGPLGWVRGRMKRRHQSQPGVTTPATPAPASGEDDEEDIL